MQIARLEFAMNEFLIPIEVKAKTEGIQSLTPVEFARLHEWESSVRLRMMSQYIQYLQGYIDQDVADGIIEAAVRDLPNWEELGIEQGNSEFDQAIEKAAAN